MSSQVGKMPESGEPAASLGLPAEALNTLPRKKGIFQSPVSALYCNECLLPLVHLREESVSVISVPRCEGADDSQKRSLSLSCSYAEQKHFLLPRLPCAMLQSPLHLSGLHWTCSMGSVSVLWWPRKPKLNLAFTDTELLEVLISSFLWLVKVPLKSSPLLQHIHHSPQSGTICKLAENIATCCPIIPVISKHITQSWPQYQYFRGTPLVTSHKLGFALLIKTLWTPSSSQFSKHLLVHLSSAYLSHIPTHLPVFTVSEGKSKIYSAHGQLWPVAHYNQVYGYLNYK